MGPTSMHESALSKTIGTLGSGSGSGSVSGSGEPIPRGPMDKFTTSQSRQTTLNSKWKQEERKEVCRKIGRFMYSKGLPFNIVNDTYWFPMIDAVTNFGPGFKPPSMHKLRTWILKEEVNDLSIIMEDHKKAWKQYGCSIMSDGWTDGKSSTWVKKVEGVKTRSTVLFDPNFWPHVAFCIKTIVPLVNVLREVDSEERPTMDYIYELMDSVKEKIAFNCRGVERKYGPIWRKIDARWTPQLHRPLHAAGYYLNPQLRYGDKFSHVDEVRKGLFECMDRMLDYQERLKADIRLDSYDQAMGEFGSRIAIDYQTLRSPTMLQDVKEIGAHLSRLRERSLQRKQNVDPILVEEIDSDDEWIAEKEDPFLPLDLCWLQDNELFSVDAIRVVLSNFQETETLSDHMVSSHSYKRKHNEVPSTSGGKGKEKELNLTPSDENEDLHEMGIHDSGHFPTIDTLDEDDDDLGDEDLS
ncbi:hypothetical protein CK203_106000 [Vitis vinifera]|uniref:DUF659 domain-containing protein n=1 Tax=Vitis vinifera TaxID=29760 RepID=A0A438DFF1_VITVI|nr:hypothetical protein CK203_106000 [Vitis vinifera]